MIKSEELADPNSCINKAAANEPVFVLRAQDGLAPATVRAWANMLVGRYRTAYGDDPVNWPEGAEEKIREAGDVADQMTRWPSRKVPD